MNLFDKSIPNKYHETCHHWISYEILEVLPEELKEKYYNQFRLPQFVFVADEGIWIPKLHCYANHFDDFDSAVIDCSSCYPKTLKELSMRFGHS